MATFDANAEAAVPDASIASLIEAHASSPWMSIEFYPPKTPEGISSLYEVLEKLKVYSPLFSDVTWGAGGSTSELTLEICKEIKRRGVVPQLHLTCTNMDAEKVFEALEGCKQAGITNLLALRGDPPAGESVWHSKGENLTCALDLIKVISAKHPDTFCIGCACYPEGHPTKMVAVEGGVEALSATEALRYSREVDEEGKETIYVCRDADFAEELLYLKQKVDAGASYCITQMFFDAEVYKFFVEACRAIGINVPIIPGIMSISTYAGFKRMAKFCKTRVPKHLEEGIEAVKDDVEAVKQFGISFGVSICKRLLEVGSPGLHYYTLNSSVVTKAIVDGVEVFAPAELVASAV